MSNVVSQNAGAKSDKGQNKTWRHRHWCCRHTSDTGNRRVVSQLTVFQRSDKYAIPMRHLVVTDANRARFPELKKHGHHAFGGFDHDFHRRVYRDFRPEQCTKAFKEIWTDASLRFSDGSFEELFLGGDVNEEIS